MNTVQMSKRWAVVGVGIAAYGWLVFYGQYLDLGFYLLLGFLVFSGWMLAAVAVLNVLGILLYSAVSKRSFRPLLRFFLALGAIGGVLMLSGPIANEIRRRAEADAKAYPDLVAPLLDQYRQRHDAYPTSLDELPSRPPVPRLLRSSYGYRSEGVHYSFMFCELFNYWTYTSETHTWHFFPD